MRPSESVSLRTLPNRSTGHQRTAALIAIGAIVVTVPLVIAGTHADGIEGAAIAAAVVNVGDNLALVYAVRVRVGVRTDASFGWPGGRPPNGGRSGHPD